MVSLYIGLINKDLWTLERVPAQWRDAVEAALANQEPTQ